MQGHCSEQGDRRRAATLTNAETAFQEVKETPPVIDDHATGPQHRDSWLVTYRALSDGAAKAVMFLITVVAARRLSRDEFGLFALGSTLGWLAAVVGDFGLQLHIARSVARQPADAARMLERWLPVRIASAALTLGVSVVALRVAGVPGGQLTPTLIFVATYTATGIAEFQFYLFRGIGRSDLESTLTLLQRVAMGVLALEALWRRPNALSLAVAMFLPAIATAIAASLQARLLAGRNRMAIEPDRHASSGIAREWFNSVAPLGLGIVFSAAYFRIDVFLIERWTGIEAVALYSAVFRIVDALRLFPAAVVAVVLPRLCRAVDTHLLTRVAAPLTAGAAIVCVALWVMAEPVVTLLFGTSYASAAVAFRPLLLALPLMALNFAATHQLIAWSGQRAYAAICAGALVLNVGLNAYLIPAAGIAGAAWSTVWTELFLTVCCAVALSRALPRNPLEIVPGTTGPMAVGG
jgi:O-antigen/teichoic acid export membrane protein